MEIRAFFIIIIVVMLSTVNLASENQTILAQTDPAAITGSGWPMAGANPQRTSWVAEEVNPANHDSYGILWYRPIEAYIGQHVQLITARDKVYVSSARGLYALDVNLGQTVWRYDTEIPLGHSPTVSGDTIYVGGFDRRIHALNADTGAVRWIFDQALAGYSTNPLVVEGKVLMGNRDGYFYAVDAADGALIWQYPKADQPPLGPILYSAAYNDGTVYFAANDNIAYALDVETGHLKWQSSQLPGDGFQAWWPVVYKNMVIFSGAVGYREYQDVGKNSIKHLIPATSAYKIAELADDFIYGYQRDEVFYPSAKHNELLGPPFEAGSTRDPSIQGWAWPNGSTVIDGQRALHYLEDDGEFRFDQPTNKFWRRTTIALNLQDGQEYTLDVDGDGHPEPLPFLPVGTKSGNQYPPVLMPDKGQTPNQIIYKSNFSKYASEWNISRQAVMGWHPDNPRYLHLTDTDFAIDEPTAISAAGNVLFTNLCCDRVGGWVNLANSEDGLFWDYHKTLESLDLHLRNTPDLLQPYQRSLASQYDEIWWASSMWLGLPRLYGGYGTVNSAYHNHGLQNPFVPYKDKLFVHRSNAIIALGPNPPDIAEATGLPQNERDVGYPATVDNHRAYEASLINAKKRAMLKYNRQKRDNVRPLSTLTLKKRLESEISKMLDAGHLRPGYYNIGQDGYGYLHNYFENPGDTLLTLALAYPHLSPALQPRVRDYLQEEYNHYFKDIMVARIGWYENPVDPSFGQLAGREAMPLPPEVLEYAKTQQKRTELTHGWPWQYPQHNFYALWKYAEIFPDQARPIYNKIKSENHLQLIGQFQGGLPLPDDDRLADNPWEHNAYIAGYIGFLNLQALADQATVDTSIREQVSAELQRLVVLRLTAFNKDQPWVGEKLKGSGGRVHRRSLSIARNFLYLTPELGNLMNEHALPQVQEAIDEYRWVAPYWFVSRYEASVSEGVQRHPFDYAALFQAKALISQESQESLTKYLDVPMFAVGDLFYIQNLIAAIEAPVLAPEQNQDDGAGVQNSRPRSAFASAFCGPMRLYKRIIILVNVLEKRVQ